MLQLFIWHTNSNASYNLGKTNVNVETGIQTYLSIILFPKDKIASYAKIIALFKSFQSPSSLSGKSVAIP